MSCNKKIAIPNLGQMTRLYLEEHDGVFACVLHEEVLEVGRAGRQHHLVALQGGSVHSQSYITECLNLRGEGKLIDYIDILLSINFLPVTNGRRH